MITILTDIKRIETELKYFLVDSAGEGLVSCIEGSRDMTEKGDRVKFVVFVVLLSLSVTMG